VLAKVSELEMELGLAKVMAKVSEWVLALALAFVEI
jgi:hypothetical protein